MGAGEGAGAGVRAGVGAGGDRPRLLDGADLGAGRWGVFFFLLRLQPDIQRRPFPIGTPPSCVSGSGLVVVRVRCVSGTTYLETPFVPWGPVWGVTDHGGGHLRVSGTLGGVLVLPGACPEGCRGEQSQEDLGGALDDGWLSGLLGFALSGVILLCADSLVPRYFAVGFMLGSGGRVRYRCESGTISVRGPVSSLAQCPKTLSGVSGGSVLTLWSSCGGVLEETESTEQTSVYCEHWVPTIEY